MLRPKLRGQGNVKLHPEEVRAILSARGKVKRKKLAAKYGVDPSTISKIWNGANWQGIKIHEVDQKRGLGE